MFLDRFIGPRTYTDEEILEAIRAGNKDILVYLFENCYREAGNFILNNKGKEKDLAAVLHEVIIHFWQLAQDEKFSPSGKITDVIVQSACALWAGMKSINTEEANVDTTLDLEIPIPESESSPWIKRLNLIAENIRLFGQEKKEIFYFTYYEKWNDEKIADVLDIKNSSEVDEKRLKALDKFENILQGTFVKRDLID